MPLAYGRQANNKSSQGLFIEHMTTDVQSAAELKSRSHNHPK